MSTDLLFFLASAMLGAGIAADAFLAALANGLNWEKYKHIRVSSAALIFATFHTVAAYLSWVLVRLIASRVDALALYLDPVAASVFCAIGIKSVVEGLTEDKARALPTRAGYASLLAQSAATSVDALSSGLFLTSYAISAVAFGLAVIAVITYAAYTAGFAIGKRFGAARSRAPLICGGLIFIMMGVQILVLGG